MGATPLHSRYRLEYQVSIHAPVVGATFKNRKSFIFINVSIHAPVMGATKSTPILPQASEFQSTRP
jgi:hypothetical protein